VEAQETSFLADCATAAVSMFFYLKHYLNALLWLFFIYFLVPGAGSSATFNKSCIKTQKGIKPFF